MRGTILPQEPWERSVGALGGEEGDGVRGLLYVGRCQQPIIIRTGSLPGPGATTAWPLLCCCSPRRGAAECIASEGQWLLGCRAAGSWSSWWPGSFWSPCPISGSPWTMLPCVPREPWWDRGTGQPHGHRLGGVWEESCAQEALAKARWECARSICVGIWAAGMRIRGMHELTAPGDGRCCSSADLHNHH